MNLSIGETLICEGEKPDFRVKEWLIQIRCPLSGRGSARKGGKDRRDGITMKNSITRALTD
jgi:hypothetical protein